MEKTNPEGLTEFIADYHLVTHFALMQLPPKLFSLSLGIHLQRIPVHPNTKMTMFFLMVYLSFAIGTLIMNPTTDEKRSLSPPK